MHKYNTLIKSIKEYKILTFILSGIILIILSRIIPLFWLFFIIWCIPFAITALAINLIFGYGGLLSFGHATLFAIGMYTSAILNFWFRINHVETLLIAGTLMSCIVSIFMGVICLRATKIQFTILTLAFQQIIHAIFHKYPIFGTPGIELPTLLGLKDYTTSILWFEIESPGPNYFLFEIYYYYIIISFIGSIALMWIIVNSSFGKALQATRDNELKAKFLGINVRRVRLLAFVISGTFTGFAGALWVPINGSTSSYIPHWDIALEFAFYPVLGGSRTFLGPILGAFVFKLIKDVAWTYLSIYWRLVVGIILILIIIQAPMGIMGNVNKLIAYISLKLKPPIEIQAVNTLKIPISMERLNDEYIVLKNNGKKGYKMVGWVISDFSPSGKQRHTYTFPARLANNYEWVLDRGEIIILHTGKGEDKFDKNEKKFHFYWGMNQPIWSNEEHVIHLYDNKGKLIRSFKIS